MKNLLKHLPWRRPSSPDLLRYWRWRSWRYGVRAVSHLALSKAELRNFIEEQKQQLFPLIRPCLAPKKSPRILDFGCGAGFFSAALAEQFDAEVLALDPIKSLLKKAPAHPRVNYILYQTEHWPAEAQNFDLIWIRHVLAGIPAQHLPSLAQKLMQSLRPGGKLFLYEKTGPFTPEKGDYWFQRPEAFYIELFKDIDLQVIARHKTLEEKISAFINDLSLPQNTLSQNETL